MTLAFHLNINSLSKSSLSKGSWEVEFVHKMMVAPHDIHIFFFAHVHIHVLWRLTIKMKLTPCPHLQMLKVEGGGGTAMLHHTCCTFYSTNINFVILYTLYRASSVNLVAEQSFPILIINLHPNHCIIFNFYRFL